MFSVFWQLLKTQVPMCDKSCDQLKKMFNDVLEKTDKKIGSEIRMQGAAILTKISNQTQSIKTIASDRQEIFAKIDKCETDKVLAQLKLNHEYTLQKLSKLEGGMTELKTYASQILSVLNLSKDKDKVEPSIMVESSTVKNVDCFGICENMLHGLFSQLENKMERQNLNVISALIENDKGIINNLTTQHISLETILKKVNYSVECMWSSMCNEFYSLNDSLANVQLTCENSDNWGQLFHGNNALAQKVTHIIDELREKSFVQPSKATKTASPSTIASTLTTTQTMTTTAKMQYTSPNTDKLVAQELKSALNEHEVQKIIEKTIIAVLATKMGTSNFDIDKKLEKINAKIHTELYMLSFMSIYACLTLILAIALFFAYCIRKRDRQATANDPERATLQESSLTSASEHHNMAFGASGRTSNTSATNSARVMMVAPPRVDTRIYGNFERHRTSTLASEQPGCSGVSGTWANNTSTSGANTDFYDASNFVTDMSTGPLADVYRPTVHETREMLCLSKNTAL